MLSPVTPAVHVPINPQLDPAQATPAVPPVVQPQAASGQVGIDLRQQEQHDRELLQERERRRRRQPRDPNAPLVEPGDALNADNTVPAVALVEGEERQGLWIDLKV